MARTYLEQAEVRLRTARSAYMEQSYAFTVRQSQECVELSLKAALRLYGVEYPRGHDVSQILLRVKERFPRWFADEIEKLAEISAELAKWRGPSMYGDEERGIPPSELFGKEHAGSAMKDAEFVYRVCRKLFRDFLKKMKEES